MSLQIVLNTLKNLYLNQYLSNFSSKKKNRKRKISNPPKNFDHLPSLEIWSTPLGLECPVS